MLKSKVDSLEENVKKETFRIDEKNDGLSAIPVAVPDAEQAKVIRGLNGILANEYVLFTKTLNFHWNITGPRFNSIHSFLDEQYHKLLEIVDGVAERIREIDGKPMGTAKEFMDKTTLTERPGMHPDTSHMIAELMADHEAIQVQIKTFLKRLSEEKDDPGTEDFLTNLLVSHEEMGWMLKSHLG